MASLCLHFGTDSPSEWTEMRPSNSQYLRSCVSTTYFAVRRLKILSSFGKSTSSIHCPCISSPLSHPTLGWRGFPLFSFPSFLPSFSGWAHCEWRCMFILDLAGAASSRQLRAPSVLSQKTLPLSPPCVLLPNTIYLPGLGTLSVPGGGKEGK